MSTSSTAAPAPAAAATPNSTAGGRPQRGAAHQVAYAPTDRNRPCAKFSTPASPKTSERPEAIRKYSAARPSPVSVSSTTVDTSGPPGRGTDAEQRAGAVGVAEQAARRAAPGDPAGRQHHGVRGQPADHGQVLL